MTPEAQSIKDTTDNLDFVKIENVWFLKGAVKRIKRQATVWEKCLQNVYLPNNLYPE